MAVESRPTLARAMTIAKTPVAWVTIPAPSAPSMRDRMIVNAKPRTAEAAAPTKPTMPPRARERLA